jgi:hypothetical protein
MIKIKLTDAEMFALIVYILELYPDSMVLNATTHQFDPKGKNPNIIGIFGEAAVFKWQGFTIAEFLILRPKYKSDAGYDIIINNMTFDIKSHPKMYDVQMINEQHKIVDGYIIVNKYSYNTFYIRGWIKQKDLQTLASFHKKDDWKNPRFQYSCDTWEVTNENLTDFK